MRKLSQFYGLDVPWRVGTLFLNSVTTGVSVAAMLYYRKQFLQWASTSLNMVPIAAISTLVWILLAAAAFYCFCFIYTLVATLYTTLVLRPLVARQLVMVVRDWSDATSVLDLGSGRGVLLATIALRLQNEGAGGRVVGYDWWPLRGEPGRFDSGTMAATLKRMGREGVGPIVTCKCGDFRKLPFPNQFFNLAFSALSLHSAGQVGSQPATGINDGWKEALKELGRVVKRGGQIVIWDALYVDAYAEFLERDGRWRDIKVVVAPSAFLMPTKVVIAQRK